MDYKAISQHIVCEATADDIALLIAAIKNRQSLLQAREVYNFRIGDKVRFESRGGRLIRGTVDKINHKTVGVSTSQGGWRVAPSLLHLDDAPQAPSIFPPV